MKICGISDIHGNLVSNIPTCDVLCICGDIIPLNIQRDPIRSKHWWLERFCKWVKELPCEKVIFTAGNHDFFLESVYKNKISDITYEEFLQQLKDNSNDKAILLINQLYNYKGIKFYGFPYIRPIDFQEGKWAFEDNYKGIGKENYYEDLVYLEADVLISHDNPINNILLDTYLNKRTKPLKYYLYGHWHEGPSNRSQGMHNCSILTDNYNIKKDFEIPTMELETERSKIEEIFGIMIDNIPIYTVLKGYDNSQVDTIKEYLELNKNFFLRQQEDEIPQPITGEVIEEEDEKDED